jgi:hypothetical protein
MTAPPPSIPSEDAELPSTACPVKAVPQTIQANATAGSAGMRWMTKGATREHKTDVVP